jgi:CRP-like cAMP-binding protein
LYNIGVVEELDEKTLLDIETVLHPVTFEEDDLVMSKGAYDNMMFFVMSGKLIAHDIGVGDSRKADIELGEGGHFGELNMLTGLPSIANVTVLTPKARLMAVTKKDYTKRCVISCIGSCMTPLFLTNTNEPPCISFCRDEAAIHLLR